MGPMTQIDEVAKEDRLTFNSGDFKVDFQMGKLVDDKQDGVEFFEVVSLNDLYSNFVLNQSIYSAYQTLNITIAESKRIFERFGSRGLQGEEFVKMKFSTPGGLEIEDLYYVTGYDGIETDQHESTNSLVLKCVSKEKLINDQMSINQSFKGPIEDAVKSIYNQLINHKLFKTLGVADEWKTHKLYFHETHNVHPFIIPGLSPFKAIHMCALRAFHFGAPVNTQGQPGSEKGMGCFYTFYKNSHGFWFHNIERRIAEDLSPGSSSMNKSYTYDSDLASEPHYSKKFYYNIKYMSPLIIGNTLDNIHDGQYASTTRTIDYNRKTFSDTNFNMKEQRNNFALMGKEPPYTTKFFDLFSAEPAEHLIVMDTINDKSPWFHHIQGRRKAYRKMLHNYLFEITINGNTRLQAGHTIDLNLKETGAFREKPLGSMYSGTWFVTSVSHVCDRGIHNTRATIVKDGLDFIHEPGTGFGG